MPVIPVLGRSGLGDLELEVIVNYAVRKREREKKRKGL